MGSIADNRKKRGRGRPPTGIGSPVGLRLYPDLEKRIDEWRRKQPDQPGRPEAIRRLLELALTGTEGPRQPSHKARSKAHQMASAQLDKVGDPSASDEEREQRKRRLLKGPREFRE